MSAIPSGYILTGYVGGQPQYSKPSKSCIAANLQSPQKPMDALAKTTVPSPGEAEASGGSFSITISGQIRGGKNNMIVTRNGRHIPKKEWAKWRDDAVTQVVNQMPLAPFFYEPIRIPTNIRVDYFAGDKRRRDMPAILDSVFHVLEKAGVVADDTLLWVSESSRSYDKANPRLTITFL